MWPYILLIMLPLLVQHVRVKRGLLLLSTSESDNGAMKLFWGVLLILLILRHESVGRDLENYKFIYSTISKSSWKSALSRSSEFGYSALNKIISLYGDNFRWVIVITALLGILFLARGYIKYSEDTSLTIALFISISNFLLLFSGLRQAIAISLGFVAYEFVRQKKIILYICIVLVAMTFHTSAFMLIFMYPLYHIKITKVWLCGIVPVLAICWVFNRQIFGYLSVILTTFTDYEVDITSTGAITMLILFWVFAIFSFIIPGKSQIDADTNGLRNYLLFAIAIQMFASLHSLAMRMNYYYIVFIPLLLPKIIKCRSVKWNQVAIVARNIMICFFVIYFFMTAPNDNVMDTFPYKFFWQK